MNCIGQYGTNFVVPTICMVGTLGNGRTPNGSIIWIIPLESWSTQALAKIANSIGTTSLILAQVITFLIIFFRTNLIGVANEVTFAPTIVAAGDVDTNGVLTTNRGQALVNVQALAEGITSVPLGTDTLRYT